MDSNGRNCRNFGLILKRGPRGPRFFWSEKFMSQKHLDPVMNADFAWFYNRPEFYNVFHDFFERWIVTQKSFSTDVSDPVQLQARVKSILKFFSEAESLATSGYNKFIEENKNKFSIGYTIDGGTFSDVYAWEISRYGKPRNMVNISGVKNASYEPSARWWKFAAIKGLWEYASPLDKSLIEYQLLSTPDFQEDNGFFQKLIRDVATPYVEYLAYAGAAVTAVTAVAAFATAAPSIASQLTGSVSASTSAATIAETGSVGTTLAEATVTVGAEAAATSGAAAAGSGGFFSTIGASLSAETAAGVASLGALAESEAKKALENEGKKALSNLVGGKNSLPSEQQPGPDAIGGSVSGGVQKNNGASVGLIGGALALLLLL